MSKDGLKGKIAYDRDALRDVVIHHWATPTSGCMCGMRLGESYADHIADMYEQAAIQRAEISRPTTMLLADLVWSYRPGSFDHSWGEEAREIRTNRLASLGALVEDIRANGIQEPILLGDDGRVWDGHHRIVAARYLHLESVRVEYGHGGNADPS